MKKKTMRGLIAEGKVRCVSCYADNDVLEDVEAVRKYYFKSFPEEDSYENTSRFINFIMKLYVERMKEKYPSIFQVLREKKSVSYTESYMQQVLDEIKNLVEAFKNSSPEKTVGFNDQV